MCSQGKLEEKGWAIINKVYTWRTQVPHQTPEELVKLLWSIITLICISSPTCGLANLK